MGTHEAIKNLIKDGFSEHDAESIIRNVQLAISSETVSKSDLLTVEYSLKTEMNDIKTELKSDIAELKSDIAVLKGDLNNVKENTATKADFAELKTEIKTNMNWIKGLLLILIGLAIKIAFFSK